MSGCRFGRADTQVRPNKVRSNGCCAGCSLEMGAHVVRLDTALRPGANYRTEIYSQLACDAAGCWHGANRALDFLISGSRKRLRRDIGLHIFTGHLPTRSAALYCCHVNAEALSQASGEGRCRGLMRTQPLLCCVAGG